MGLGEYRQTLLFRHQLQPGWRRYPGAIILRATDICQKRHVNHRRFKGRFADRKRPEFWEIKNENNAPILTAIAGRDKSGSVLSVIIINRDLEEIIQYPHERQEFQ